MNTESSNKIPNNKDVEECVEQFAENLCTDLNKYKEVPVEK